MAIVIYNKIIPFSGCKAVTILPFIFSRAKELEDYFLNHETIHLRQQLEVLIVSLCVILLLICFIHISWWWLCAAPLVYFLWYGMEYAIRLLVYFDTHKAYRNISVEQEAYDNQYDFTYLSKRKLFAWVGYIGKTTYNK